jgi:hypothetical protein
MPAMTPSSGGSHSSNRDVAVRLSDGRDQVRSASELLAVVGIFLRLV